MHLSHFIPSLVLMGLMLPAAAFGVDGVILIDQNKAMAGNITPGDTPGFPVTISQPGSYRLDSNLTVPDANTTAILITANNVTLDLNGFSIIGSTQCMYYIHAGNVKIFVTGCNTTGTGVGVLGGAVGDLSAIKVMNGTVEGMGSDGIRLFGDAITVEKVNAISNGGNGFLLTSSVETYGAPSTQTLTDSVGSRNGSNGGEIVSGSVTRTRLTLNAGAGLKVWQYGTVTNSIFQENLGYGIYSVILIKYQGNTFSTYLPWSSTFGPGYVYPEGISYNFGQNTCDLTVCP